MKHKYCGKMYANGTVIQYPDTGPKRFNFEDTTKRERTNKKFVLKFKQRMKIYDAITFQNHQANQVNELNHCFLTMTFRSDHIPDKPNQVVSDFFDKMRKAGFLNYVWVREVGPGGGLVHYHSTFVGPRRPINSAKGWNINQCWCDSRGYYSPNAVRTGINPGTGKSQLVINSLLDARRYVAKYMTKGQAQFKHDNRTGRVYGISNELFLPPVQYKDSIDFAFHPYYRTDKDVFYTNWATIGYIQPEKAINLYNQLNESL